MRVKAFTLVELIVVILLLGVIFSLALSTFNSKKNIFKNPSLKDLPKYIQKIKPKGRLSFYIYGKNCNKDIFLYLGKVYSDKISIPFKSNYRVYKKDYSGLLKITDFEPLVLDKKEHHVCLKLDIYSRRFIDKFIIQKSGTYLLFEPFYQGTMSFSTFQDAKRRYIQEDLYPRSVDDYHHQQ